MSSFTLHSYYTYARPIPGAVFDTSFSADANYVVSMDAGVQHMSLSAGSYFAHEDADLQMVDQYWIVGSAPGVPVNFEIALDVETEQTETCCYDYMPSYGSAGASLTDGAASRSLAHSGYGFFHDTLAIAETRQPFEPFPLWTTLSVGLIAEYRESAPGAAGVVRFDGLPPGTFIVSCLGYNSAPPTPALASCVSAIATDGIVRMVWSVPDGDGKSLAIERAESDSWSQIAQELLPSDGLLRYEDANVVAGTRYGYRLVVGTGDGEQRTTITWIQVPFEVTTPKLALFPNPANVTPSASLGLVAGLRADLAIFDISGRRLNSWRYEAGRGRTILVPMGTASSLSPGVYAVVLEQGAQRVSRRLVVIK